MASNAPVSAAIDALLEQLGAAMAGTAPAPTPATFYAQLIRIRDEAALLEVRATDRDAKVRELLADLAAAADRLQQLPHIRPNWFGVDYANGPHTSTVAVINARRCGKTAANEDEEAELERRWSKIRGAYLQRRDGSQGEQP